jgi:hypothetical protein
MSSRPPPSLTVIKTLPLNTTAAELGAQITARAGEHREYPQSLETVHVLVLGLVLNLVPTTGPDGCTHLGGLRPESQRQESPRPETREGVVS